MLVLSPRFPCKEILVLNTLRSPRNRPYLHTLVFVLLVSWLSMLISATCAMPSSARTSSANTMPAGCSEPEHLSLHHNGHTAMSDQNCSSKSCLDSQPNPAFEFKIDKSHIPIFILCLLGLIGYLFHYASTQRIPRATAPPIGRRVLLIYRYCTLLN
jgi:hypothetical protein